MNLQIARAYLAASDPQIATRNWQFVMDEMVKLKKDETQHRWQTAIKDKAFDSIRHLPLLETRPEHFLRVLEAGKVSTNVYLRRIHNFALDMTWLPWPVLAKKRWPAVEFKEKRGITLDEHQAIVARELNPERKAFYKLAWHLGASQSDLAFLEAENVDWDNHVISYERKKTGSIAIMRFDEDMAEILRDLPGNGPLFPYLRTVRAGDRATEFKQRCDRTWHQRRVVAQLSLCVGGTGKKGGLSRTVCAGESGPQQQGHSSRVCAQGPGGTAAVERI